MISDKQHGFYYNAKSTMYLLQIYKYILSTQIDVVYADIRKAFDRKNLSILIKKFK